MLEQQVVHCPTCERDIAGTVHTRYDNPCAHSLGPYEESYHRYALVSCPECGHPFLTVETGHPAGSCFAGPWVLYPQRGETISVAVPDSIRKCFYEAQRCYLEHHYRATSVLCRAILELTAKDKGIENGNLEKKIDKLREQRYLSEDLHTWAHQIRFFGNDGAHDPEPAIDHTSGRDALDLVKAILDYVYSLRDKFERFNQRKGVEPTR